MKNELTIQHLAPYLPYGLKGMFRVGDALPHLVKIADEVREKTLSQSNIEFFMLHCKPILRPLSDLTKEIEHNGERFVPIEWFEEKYYTLDLHKQCLKFLEEDGENWINQSNFMLVQHLIEWHFDVFGLIEKGLAIPYSDL